MAIFDINKLSVTTAGAAFVALPPFFAVHPAESASLGGDYLISISLDGKAEQIGQIGFSEVFGLTFNSGELRGYTANNQEIAINSVSGAGTFVQNVTGINSSIFGATSSTSGVTFLASGNGQIGTVNTSGTFTSLSNNERVVYDIAISSNNELFGAAGEDGLTRINQSTGLFSFIGGSAIFINALGFSGNDTLYGAGADNSSFYTIDTSTGAASFVSTIPGFFSSGDIVFDSANDRFFATSSSPLTPVPEPSFSVGTLAFSILGVSYLVRRKNRSTC